MSSLIRHRNLISLIKQTQTRFVHRNHPGHKPKPLAVQVKHELPDNYLPEAIYPPVKPKFPPNGPWLDNMNTKLAWSYYEEGQKFHSLKTIQERLSVMAYMNAQQTIDDLKIERVRHYPIFCLSSWPKAPRTFPFAQYITKTNVSVVKNLSSISSKSDDENVELNRSIDADLYEKLRNSVIDTILVNFSQRSELSDVPEALTHPESYKPDVLENEKLVNEKEKQSNKLIQNIFEKITSILSINNSNEHLFNAQYGNNVNVKSYWKRCGFEEQSPRGAVHPDPDVIRFQFEDTATYQIKCDKPLKPLFKLDDSKCTESPVKDYAYHPISYKMYADHILPMQVPGHWYGDQREFNFLTIYNTTKMFNYHRTKFADYNEDLDCLKTMAITSGHAELTAQAYYLGFSMWKDVTYPLLGQFILSNGQDFTLANYQLNTTRLWNKAIPLNNLCNLTIPERLFELSNEKTELVKFNDNLFKKILNLLTNKPIKNDEEIFENYSELDHMIGGSRLRPYLSIRNFDEQLSKRHQLLAISLYELVKYDKPMTYLNLRAQSSPKSYRPKFHNLYNKYTFQFRDIILNYYPRDYYGKELVERLLKKKSGKITEKYWDLKTPVYEWANVPPPDTNNIPRNIQLPTY